jgi:hypothetical protein
MQVGLAQIDSIKLIGLLEDKKVRVYNISNGCQQKIKSEYTDFSWEYTDYSDRVILVQQNNNKSDTLLLFCNDWLEGYIKIDTCFVQAIQIDGKGQREIILAINMNGREILGESGALTVKKTLNEIWNIDTKEKLFSAISDYEYSSEYIHIDNDDTSIYIHETTEFSYKYNWSINDNGRITIKGIQTKHLLESYRNDCSSEIPGYCLKYHICPDHEEGIYEFVNGKYILKE